MIEGSERLLQVIGQPLDGGLWGAYAGDLKHTDSSSILKIRSAQSPHDCVGPKTIFKHFGKLRTVILTNSEFFALN